MRIQGTKASVASSYLNRVKKSCNSMGIVYGLLKIIRVPNSANAASRLRTACLYKNKENLLYVQAQRRLSLFLCTQFLLRAKKESRLRDSLRASGLRSSNFFSASCASLERSEFYVLGNSGGIS